MYAIVESGEETRYKPGVYRSQLFTIVTKEVGKIVDNRVQSTTFYLADVDAFEDPLVVVPNIGGAPNLYLMMTPRAKWADGFGKWLDKGYEKLEALCDTDEESTLNPEESDGKEDDSDQSEDSSKQLEEDSGDDSE